MKITFEINTTCSRPFHITVSEETPMFEVRKIIISEIEYHTILMKDDVIDLFIVCKDKCVSIDELSNDTVKLFIDKYPEYFHKNGLFMLSNFHPLFIMDQPYLDKIQNNNEAPVYKDINSSNEENIIKMFMTTAVSLLTGINMQ